MSVGAVNKQTGERIPTAGIPAVDSVLSGTSTNPVQNRVVKEALDDKADTDMVAADFNAGSSYTAGNYCVQDGKLYKFKNNHSGAWSSADVDEVKITGELSALKSGLTNVGLVEDGTITAQEGVTITSYILKKVNHVVNLQMLVMFTPTIGTATILTVLPSGFRPLARLKFACVNDTSGKLTKAECDSWGAVRIDPSSDDSSAVSTYYFLTTTFIVA